MAHTMANEMGFTGTEARADSGAYQAYQILRLGFTVAPIVAGLDKFLHFLVDWDKYLPATVNNMAGGHGHELMLVVGVIEGIAGIGGFLKPRVFAYFVAAWVGVCLFQFLFCSGG